jgi:hypothetical protein
MAELDRKEELLQRRMVEAEKAYMIASRPELNHALYRAKVYTIDTNEKKVVKFSDRTVELIDQRNSGWMTQDDWRSWYSHVRHVGEHNARDRQRAANENAQAVFRAANAYVQDLMNKEAARLEVAAQTKWRSQQVAFRKEEEAIHTERNAIQNQFTIDTQKLSKREQMEQMLEDLKRQDLTPEEFERIKREFEAALGKEETLIEDTATWTQKRNEMIDAIKTELRSWMQQNPFRLPPKKTVYTEFTDTVRSFTIPSGSYTAKNVDNSGWMLDHQWDNWKRLLREEGGGRRAKERQIAYNTEAGQLVAVAAAEQVKKDDQWEKDKVAAKEAYFDKKGEVLDVIINSAQDLFKLPQPEFLKVKETLGRMTAAERSALDAEVAKVNEAIQYPRIILDTAETKVIITQEGETHKLVNRDGSGWMTESDWQNWWARHKAGEHRSAAEHKAGYNARATALLQGKTSDQAETSANEAYQTLSHEHHKAAEQTGVKKLFNDAKKVAGDLGKTALDILGGPEQAAGVILGIAALAVLVPLVIIILKKYMGGKGVKLNDSEAQEMADTIVQRRQTDIGGLKNQLEAGKLGEDAFQMNLSAITISEANKIIAEAKAEEDAKKKKKLFIAGGVGTAATAVAAFMAWLIFKPK